MSGGYFNLRSTNMEFLVLLFAHLLGDYPLQREFLSAEKGDNIIFLFSHAGIWTGCIATAGFVMGFNIQFIDIALLFIVHSVADYLKGQKKLWYKNMDDLREGLLIDQLIHVGQVLLFLYMNI